MASPSTIDTIMTTAHNLTESQIRDSVQNLTDRCRRTLKTHGHIPVRHAIEANKDPLGVVPALLKLDIDVNRLDTFGSALLHDAVMSRNAALVKAILQARPHDLNLNVANRKGVTPVHMAVRLGCSKVVKLFVHDPRTNLGAKTAKHQTALHLACGSDINGDRSNPHRHIQHSSSPSSKEMFDIVNVLLASAADGITSVRSFPQFLHQRDVHGRTCLHYAAQNGLDEMVPEILKASLDHHENNQCRDADDLALIADNNGCLSVHLAAEEGHLALVQRLLVFKHTPLQRRKLMTHAVKGGHTAIVRECLKPEHRPYAHHSRGQSVHANYHLEKELHIIVDFYLGLLDVTAHPDMACFLLATLDSHLTGGREYLYAASLLHWAVLVNGTDHGALLIKHILKWHPETANALLDLKAQQTALHIATIMENLQAVEALDRESGSYLSANEKDAHKKTALDYAFHKQNQGIHRILTKRQDVQEHLNRLHKNRETYVMASNAILVVAVLVATITHMSCPTPQEAQKLRAQGMTKFQIGETFFLSQFAFLFSMLSTILGAFAALPFSFGFSFVQTVDDSHVGRSLVKTRFLVVLASYFLMLSLVAVLISFICSQHIAPHVNCDCKKTCWIALALFLVVTMPFLVINAARVWKWKRLRANPSSGDRRELVMEPNSTVSGLHIQAFSNVDSLQSVERMGTETGFDVDLCMV